MEHLIIPEGYEPALNLHDTQIAIKTVKDFFQDLLAKQLNLLRVSAPLFVDPASGLNDNLNGVERPVSFDIKEQSGFNAEVVHSLAKWKRYALKEYGFSNGEGLYTDMNAIRRDETTDNIHSIFVDQWDWEKIISKEDRTLDTLKSVVRDVYKTLRKTEMYMAIQYDYIEEILPKEIFFITSQELLDMYPDKTPKEREYLITKEKKAVCLCRLVISLEMASRMTDVHQIMMTGHSTPIFLSTIQFLILLLSFPPWVFVLMRTLFALSLIRLAAQSAPTLPSKRQY